jgi:S-adenosylmethionine:diacylglycerol 3-amino-3-carboxypropyl transferase
MSKYVATPSHEAIYIYASEMVCSYYKKVGVKGKRVLTVAASGDQIINAYLLGAKKVVGFDVNPKACNLSQLKIIALKKLGFSDFKMFFSTFDYKVYTELRAFLDVKTKSFFDGLYKEFNFNGKDILASRYVQKRNFSSYSAYNFYLKNKKSYEKAKKAIGSKNTAIVRSNITEISNRLDEKFDLVNLSNVPNYFASQYPNGKDPRLFINKVLLPLNRVLAKRGKVIFYNYSVKNYPNNVSKTIPPLAQRKNLSVIKRLSGYKYSEISFKGLNGHLDKTVILEKV